MSDQWTGTQGTDCDLTTINDTLWQTKFSHDFNNEYSPKTTGRNPSVVGVLRATFNAVRDSLPLRYVLAWRRILKDLGNDAFRS